MNLDTIITDIIGENTPATTDTTIGVGKVKLTPSERMELKVRKIQAKRDSLLEILDKKIRALEGELDKARSLRVKLGGDAGSGVKPTPNSPPAAPLRGFRADGMRPAEAQLDALIRQGKL